MSSQFSMLWTDLCKTGPMTKARDTDFERDRRDIMMQLGMLGDKGGTGKKTNKAMGPPRAQASKHHGKKARALAGEAQEKALRTDSKAGAIRRLEVQSMVHEVEAKNDISKEMAVYVKAGEPIPPRLMKKLLGGKMTKPRALPPLIEKKIDGYVPPPTDKTTVARNPNTHILHAMNTNNKWPAEERKHLIALYREVEKPQNANVELWKIYYTRLADRYRSLYPHRKPKEITDKLQEMITKRQFHDEKEISHWKAMKGNKTSTAAAEAIVSAQHTEDLNTISMITPSLSPSKSPSRNLNQIISDANGGSQIIGGSTAGSRSGAGAGTTGTGIKTKTNRGDASASIRSSKSQQSNSKLSRARSPITVNSKGNRRGNQSAR